MSLDSRALLQRAVRLAGLPFETHDPERVVDAIVVLGAPIRSDGKLSKPARERVLEAVALWEKGLAPLVAFTGGSPHSLPEAPAMAARARELGIPAEAIVMEDRSQTTAENARFIAELLRARGVRTVWVVSQPFHLRRGRRLLRQQGFEASAQARPESVQYQHPYTASRWVAREYLAWVAHFVLPGY